MYKKIIILTVLFVGLSTMAFYSAHDEEVREPKIANITNQYSPIVVLELFTSQGCSSCPPADALLDKAKSDFPNKVFALSYHVDYWNYIGWKDPFSKSAYTIKQRAYNKKFNSRSNYTPQMVVNGREHFVGSNSSKLGAKISVYGKEKVANQIQIPKVGKQANRVTFDYEIKGDLNGKTLHAVLVVDKQLTEVKRGENRNRTLKNSNIVIAENYYLPKASLGSESITIPKQFFGNDDLSLFLILEHDDLTITGAAKEKI